MRVAAIDVGTNSIHLLIAELSPAGEFTLIEKARRQVELGTGGLDSEFITPDAAERGLAAMKAFKEACDSFGVEDIHTAATSAVREAQNGVEFCKRVKRETGIHVRIISGSEEARLIWLGARQHLDFSRGRVMLCDLGGGSTEFILCDAESSLLGASIPIGHIRLTEAFVDAEQVTTEQLNTLAKHVRKKLKPLALRVRPDDFSGLVGTSGTARCLARMATHARGVTPPQHGDGLVLERHELDAILELFAAHPLASLRGTPGLDERRLRTLPSGAIVLREVMDLFGKKRLVTSDHSLRDGLVVDWVMRNRPELQLSAMVSDPRRRSVLAAMRRYQVDKAHAESTARCALQLFDETITRHHLRIDDRRLLEFASLLHDVGHHISGEDHHKHGAYLIQHTRLSGFTAPEIVLLATIVRFHRGKRPKKSMPEFAHFSSEDQRRVRILVGILRIADGLDRGHDQNVHLLSVIDDGDSLTIRSRVSDAGHLERWATVRRKQMLERSLGVPIRLEMEAPRAAAQTTS